MSAPALVLPDCPRCDSPIEKGDLRCAVCSFAVRDLGADIETTKANVVRCQGCGACVSYDVRAQAPKCAFCGEEMRVESVEDPIEQAEAALPFDVTPERAQEAVRKWLGTRGFFCPSDLKSASTIDGLKALWWPAWVFSVQTEISWTGDSNAGAHRSDWAPHSGLTRASFENIIVSASRGLTEAECAAIAQGTQISKATQNAKGPEGAVTEQFDVQRSSARERILKAVHSLAASTAEKEIPGSRTRNIKVSTIIRGLRSRRISIPTYVLAYRYRDKLYRAVVHGQDAKHITGTTPTSWIKVFAVTFAVIAAIGLLIAFLAN